MPARRVLGPSPSSKTPAAASFAHQLPLVWSNAPSARRFALEGVVVVEAVSPPTLPPPATAQSSPMRSSLVWSNALSPRRFALDFRLP